MVLLRNPPMHSSAIVLFVAVDALGFDCRLGKGARKAVVTFVVGRATCPRRARAAERQTRGQASPCPPCRLLPSSRIRLEGVARAFAHDPAETGKPQMRAGDRELVGGRLIEQAS